MQCSECTVSREAYPYFALHTIKDIILSLTFLLIPVRARANVQVRSVTLDSWTHGLAALFQDLGNRNVNSIYEHMMGGGWTQLRGRGAAGVGRQGIINSRTQSI